MYEDLVPPYSLWHRAGLGYYVRFQTRLGKPIRKSLKTDDEKEAHRRAPSVIDKALKTGPLDLKLVVDLLPLVRRDYELNARRSTGKVVHAIARLTDRLAGYRLGQFSSADVLQYVESRKREGAANATINRELSVLRRGFNLAVKTAGLPRDVVPTIQALKENAPRSGFFERHQFDALLPHLRPEIKPVAEFAYEVGWRLREILNLEWRHVDLNEGTVRLDPGTTKNGEGRVAYLSPALLDLLRAQRAATRELELKKGIIILWVFHRRGKRILRFLASWRTACRNAGVPGMFFHDLRRTAVRNMVRAGIPERVAMQISGHKTRSVFERYNIVSESDLRDAAERLAVARSRSNGAVSPVLRRLPDGRTHL
jgi:integrase